MRRRILASVAVATFIAVPAIAADLPVKAPAYRAPPPVEVYGWTGLYIGGSVGARLANANWTTTSISGFPTDLTTAQTSFRSTSFRGGGYLGYNWQLSQQWVAGFEVDGAWANNSRTNGGIPGTFGPTIAGFGGPGAAFGDFSQVKETWDASARGRLGFLVTPTLLLYGTGGVSFIHREVTASCTGPAGPVSWCTTARSETYSQNKVGWTAGAGLETMWGPNWLARAEYRYAQYGGESHTYFSAAPIDSFTANVKVSTHIALFGLAYRFGGPVSARY
jgi:outer membrane immunogenic protein